MSLISVRYIIANIGFINRVDKVIWQLLRDSSADVLGVSSSL